MEREENMDKRDGERHSSGIKIILTREMLLAKSSLQWFNFMGKNTFVTHTHTSVSTDQVAMCGASGISGGGGKRGGLTGEGGWRLLI